MGKKRKGKKRKGKKRLAPKVPVGTGFDFGERPNVAALSDNSFITSLNEAEVIGCAYGLVKPPGFSSMIPILSFVGQNETKLREAFDSFKAWGCEDDGDVVNVELLLHDDGTYKAWVGPEMRRLLFRCIPQADLNDPHVFGMSWVKIMDTTNPSLFDMYDYLASSITPIQISGAIIEAGKVLAPENLKDLTDLPNLIKFDLKIIKESDIPRDPRFDLKSGNKPPQEPKTKPSRYESARRKVLDFAFPVLRERVRRARTFEAVRQKSLLQEVTEVQVVQAVANLVLSEEICPGDAHFAQVSGDLAKTLWSHLSERQELADGNDNVAELPIDSICHQIELDVRYFLGRQGIPQHTMKFSSLQRMLLRKGYVR